MVKPIPAEGEEGWLRFAQWKEQILLFTWGVILQLNACLIFMKLTEKLNII